MTARKKRSTAAEMRLWRERLYLIVAELRPATVRQVFYQATVRGLVEKTENAYKRVAQTLADLRKEGAMPYDWLADATRWQRRPRSADSLAGAIAECARYYRRDALSRADRYVDVWLEKEALSGVVVDSTGEYDVPLMVARGFSSLSFLHTAAMAIKDEHRSTTIYHLGDYDPSGQCAARTIKATLESMSGRDDMEFVQLAVTPEQIREWHLPARPTKRDGNAHAKGWEGDSVELDAIHPESLRALVTDALARHMPAHELQALRAAEASERRALEMFSRGISSAHRPDRALNIMAARMMAGPYPGDPHLAD